MLVPDLATDSDLTEMQADLKLILDAAKEAGRIALGYFGKNPRVWMKKGDSPVSEADHAADQYLRETLLAARPDYGWLSEETTDNLERLDRKRVFVVDPIDGTRGFIKGNRKWCVSVAIVEAGRPYCGVLECPATAESYWALKGAGAYCNDRRLAARPAGKPLHLAGPKPMVREFARKAGVEAELAQFVPSLAYRLARVADGRFDGAFARANCHDWDIAAADLIVSESGAILSGLNGGEIIYNRAQIQHGVLVAAYDPLYTSMLSAARSELKSELS